MRVRKFLFIALTLSSWKFGISVRLFAFSPISDINPIGAIAKGDIKRFLLYAATHYGLPSLADVAHAAPTAELVPTVVDSATGQAVAQLDEVDSE